MHKNHLKTICQLTEVQENKKVLHTIRTQSEQKILPKKKLACNLKGVLNLSACEKVQTDIGLLLICVDVSFLICRKCLCQK